MKKGIKYLIVASILFLFIIISILVYSSKSISGKVYDIQSDKPLSGVQVVVKSYEGSYMFGDHKEQDDIFYTGTEGKYKGKMAYAHLESISFSKEGYISHYESNEYAKLKSKKKFYLVKQEHPLNVNVSKLSTHAYNEGGKAFLENGDYFVFSYDLIEDKNQYYSMFRSSSKKVSFPKGGLIYLGDRTNLFNELKEVPESGYTNSSIEFKEGVYAFKTNDGLFGKANLMFIDSEDNGKFNLYVTGNYVISNNGTNVETRS